MFATAPYEDDDDFQVSPFWGWSSCPQKADEYDPYDDSWQEEEDGEAKDE